MPNVRIENLPNTASALNAPDFFVISQGGVAMKLAASILRTSLGIANSTRATVTQIGGQTVALAVDGTTITSLPTTATNNVTVIQAAIDAIAGAATSPHNGTGSQAYFGGGGTVWLSEHLYDVASTITLKYGVTLMGSGSADRWGLVANNMDSLGTTLRATSGNAGPILAIGTSQAGNGIRSTTNPHGVLISNISFVGYNTTNSLYGIRIRDTSQLHIMFCSFIGFTATSAAAIRVESTNTPDKGSISTEIMECYFSDNTNHLETSGTGATDGRIIGGRWLQHGVYGAYISHGGWQVMGGHWTTGVNGSAATHVFCDSAPIIIRDNYFDTTGTHAAGYHLVISTACTIGGNHFKSSTGSTCPAAVQLTGNGTKCTITGNSHVTANGTKGFVEVDSASSNSMYIEGNLCDNDGTSWVAPVVTAAGAGVTTDTATRFVTRNAQNSLV